MAQFLTNERFGNGSDGAYAPSTGTDAPIDSACTGTISTTSLSATNVSFTAGQIIMIHQTRGTGAGQWELNVIASYTAGTITTKYALTYGYVSGAQVLVVSQHSTGLIDTGVTIKSKGWNGTVGGIYAKAATGLFSIVGTLSATGSSASGQTEGTADGGFDGGAVPGSGSGNCGEGTSGASTQQSSANGNGGGGGSTTGSGAGGGNGTGGASGSGVSPGTGGGTSGNSGLTLMTFGGAGGSAVQGGNGGGAAGGGIVFIFAKTISVTGSVTSTGGTGGNGTNYGGGGGAGGSILFKGQSITLGSSLVTAAGGAGGTGGSNAGGAGGNGRIHADYSNSISGSTSPALDSTQDSTLTDAFYGSMI